MRKICLVFLAGVLVGTIGVGVPLILLNESLKAEIADTEMAHQQAVEETERLRAEALLERGLAASQKADDNISLLWLAKFLEEPNVKKGKK
jgi:hypothetical protein